MNVFGYTRVSGLGQVEGDGPQRQLEAIQSFCQSQNITLITHFFEGGVSGTTDALDRPEFLKMLNEIDRRNELVGDGLKIEALVVERMDRIARDLMVSELLLRELRERGIKLFAVDQGALIDVASNDGDPTRKLLRQILGAVAEWEKSVLVYKLKIARQRSRKIAGRCEGRKPYGERPGEQQIKDQIIAWRDNGFTIRQIHNFLNNQNMPTRYGKKWGISSVYSVLTNS